MAKLTMLGLLTVGLCLIGAALAEKQIKLEDIERDNLRAAQQAKQEKQYQQLQQAQQYQNYQQYPIQYQYTPGLTYPAYQQYVQYVQPQQQQQYVPQQLYASYAPVSNSISGSYSASSAHPFQSYYSQQLTAALQGLQAGHQYRTQAPTQQYLMAFATPLAGLQQQSYYQVLPKTQVQQYVQYVPSQTTHTAQYYYQPQATHSGTATAASSAGAVYIPAFQAAQSAKTATSFQQYVTAPQTFTASYTPSSSSSSSSSHYSSYTAAPSTYSSNVVYQSQQPTFVSVKAPQHLVASPGQQQQYLQAQTEVSTTTVAPFKYLNSPQYLAQNYNTIQSSHLLPKHPYSSGIKSTAIPPVKVTGGPFVTPNSSGSNNGSSYHAYRSIAG